MTRGPFIQTYSGKFFYPLDPRPEDICIEDIAHHLATMNRYNGAASFPVSVAQHCCYVSDYCSNENKLFGLLHDAEEAYGPDIPGPYKHNFNWGEWLGFAKLIKQTIYTKFGLSLVEPEEIKQLDKLILGNEHRQLMINHFDLPYIDGLVIEEWSWKKAQNEFMGRFGGLQRG